MVFSANLCGIRENKIKVILTHASKARIPHFSAFPINKIPKPYRHLKSTQDIFLKCYFNNNEVSVSLKKLTESDEHNFSRYNFFLINYLLYKNEISEAKIIIEDSRKKHDSNLLLKETEFLLLKNENQKIKSFFNFLYRIYVIMQFTPNTHVL